jgi:glycosyltransferase involved in cell wall biosynthesis
MALAHLGAYLVRSGGRPKGGVPRHLDRLLRVARYTQAPALRSVIRGALAPWTLARTDAAARHFSSPATKRASACEEEVRAVLLLKAPTEGGEKGVLFAGNEAPWPALVRVARRTDLLDRYDLVALSAWSPPKYTKLAEFVGLSADPIHIGISNRDDVDAYRLLAPAIVPLPLMASDWLNPDDFAPRPAAERDIHILMVSGWGRYKRHWLLFEALRGLTRDLQVVLIGANSGNRTLEDVKAEARLFGVRQQLKFLSEVPVEEVYAHQARARVCVIFSGREGACVAVTESFFADTPVGLMHDAHVGSKAHINPATGVLFHRGALSRQLGEFLESRDRFHPRAWALEHISCHRSSATLNEVLRSRALESGRPWTRDVAPLFRRYFLPRYLRAADAEALRPGRDELHRKYGLKLLLADPPTVTRGAAEAAPDQRR